MKNKNVPEIRFSGFRDNWELCKLKKITEQVKGNDGRMDIPTLTISASLGWLDQRDRFSGNIAGKEQKNYTLLKKGQLSYNHGNSKLAKYGVVFSLRTFEEALVPKVYHSFKVTNEASSDFVEYVFATKIPDRELGKLVSSGARMDGLLNIGYENFSNIKILIPKKEEQMKISNFLRQLDSTIALHQHKLSLLKQTKQGFLQKMFPKEGKSVPEFRFPGFTDAWELRKLGDIGSVAMCKRIFKEETSDSDEVPFYKIGTFGGEPDAYISRELFEEYKSKYPYPENGDLLISASGSIGRIVEYKGKDEYFQDSNIVWLKHDNKIINSFLKQFYGVVKWKGLEGSTIKRLYNKNILETEIMIPSTDEQIKIGDFFKQLDQTIALHQRELDLLKETKKGFLQKLFV
ncbi:restriction endonuclease subunit S [Carnobacterium maltaromaticum]|uniref:restriction endonuclease subunit S n=1 Tax=Carnobacterium maltaromaticum TaxID=2751 RepID=UPI00295F042F|nr:restriction endonuclease subunit S [Carnobacterium maltaromaticum]